jgi:hypothetical protein
MVKVDFEMHGGMPGISLIHDRTKKLLHIKALVVETEDTLAEDEFLWHNTRSGLTQIEA